MGAAYCARRMCPWNSKKERSSAVVASRWMLPTLTLVFSMAAAPGFFLVGGPGQNPDNPLVGSFVITPRAERPKANLRLDLQ